jgi:hypothetical protein
MRRTIKAIGGVVLPEFYILCLVGERLLTPTTYFPAIITSRH